METDKKVPTLPSKQQEAAPQQLVFDMFRDMALAEQTIDQASKEIGFTKANILFDMREIGLLGRRLLDAAFWYASEKLDQDNFDVNLEYFKWLMKFESNNHAHLKRCIREAQSSAIQVQTTDERGNEAWVSVPLLGKGGIAKGRFVYYLDKDIKRLLADPQSRSFLSIRITAAFSSAYAHALYGLLVPSRQAGETGWISLQSFRESVGATAKSFDKYGDFKRYVLTPAIDQLNELSDLLVTVDTRAAEGGKRITHLKFQMSENPAATRRLLGSKAPTDEMIYNLLVKEFGVSQSELQEISSMRAMWTDERLLSAIEFARHRCQSGRVKYPGAYVMKAIREGLQLAEFEKDVAPAKSRVRKSHPASTALSSGAAEAELDLPLPGRDAANARQVHSEIDVAIEAFERKEAAEKKAIFDDYRAKQRRKTKLASIDDMLASRIERAKFAAYLTANHL